MLAPPTTSAPGGPGAAAAAAVVPQEAPASDACGPIIRKKSGRAWRCTFVDDFSGRRLDPHKWIVHDTNETGWRWGITCFTPSRRNVKVSHGRLRLTVHRTTTFRCGPLLRSFSTKYTGGLVGTKGHFGQTYGRFEVRARWPTATKSGLHGGFWMNPVESVYGRWPNSGEIDVSEWWSSRRRQVVSALHYKGRVRQADSGLNCFVNNPSRFHVYTVIWRPQIIRFLYDGRQCFARRWEPAAPQERPQPFDQDFSMILGMGVGEVIGRQKVTEETELPGRYIIDYAKAWR